METNRMNTVLIMAGGTGGHVFPALSVAALLRDKGVKVYWLGTNTGIESRVVPAQGFTLYTINISGLRGKRITALLALPFKMLSSFVKTAWIIHKTKPSVVLGMGGFVSGPGGLAAKFMRKKLIIHEQNAVPGFTNKILRKLANKILESFPTTFTASAKVFHTGNPVRANIYRLAPPHERFQQRTHPLRILILGGSLGAVKLNEIIPMALRQVSVHLPIEIWHQTGKHKFDEVKNYYETHHISAKVTPFIEAMEDAYAWADIVICRAGASTITELMAVGVPSILIPFPFATDNHQLANANYLVNKRAALLLEQSQLTPEKLAAMIHSISHSSKLESMAQAAYQCRQADATLRVAEHCLEYV